MHQMKLRTFFLFFYTLIIFFLVGYLYVAVMQYKKEYAHLLSDRSLAVASELSNIYITVINMGHSDLMQPIIAAMPSHRPFLKAVALSADATTLQYASDKNLIGYPLPPTTVIRNESIVSALLEGNTSFSYPIAFKLNGTNHFAILYLQLDPSAMSADPFLAHLYSDFILAGLTFLVIIFVLYTIIRWYVIHPIGLFKKLIVTRKSEEVSFGIRDLSDLYSRISQSYIELEKKELSLQLSLDEKNYLNEIFQTMHLINRLIISNKSCDQFMHESCVLLAQHGHYHLAWIGIVVDDRIEIVAHSKDKSNYIAHLDISLDTHNLSSKGPSAQCILTNKTIITQSLNLEYYDEWRIEAINAGHASSICLPLRASINENPYGELAIYSTKPFGFFNQEITMLEDLAGDIGYAIAMRRKNNELQHALSIDKLTQLPTRGLLLDELANNKNHNLLLININRFGDINTVYGFDAGDFILSAFSKTLQKFVPANRGKVFRLHSNTFAIYFYDTYGNDYSHMFIESISSALCEHPYTYNGIDIWISITASYSDSEQQIVENAEIAMRYAKESQIRFQPFYHSLRVNKEHEENILWYKIIRDAIKEDCVIPYFQPIVNNKTKKIEKYEALMRLTMRDGTVASPLKFIPIAKKTGLYPQLTKIMIQKTLKILQSQPLRISLNISTEDIESNDIVGFLRDAISHDSIGKKIVFEILESEGIENYTKVINFITEFKNLGCQFALDDFGSGYSNFDHLIKLQVDYIKIDGSLIKNILHDKNAQVIVRNIHNFAAEMSIATIAEFVSSMEIYDLVTSMGIHYSQGYYFSEPTQNLLT